MSFMPFLLILAAARLINAQAPPSAAAAELNSGPAQISTFQWDCLKSPGTCNNACWHIRCSGAQNVLPLTFDANFVHRPDRRQASGCALKPCMQYPELNGPDGSQKSCDDFPWAATQQGGAGASLRCVSFDDNSDQGDQFGDFRESLKNGQQFDITITNFQNSPFCLDTSCENDEYQFTLQQDGFFYYAASASQQFSPSQQQSQQQSPQGMQKVQARDEPDGADAIGKSYFFRRYIDQNGVEHLHLPAKRDESLVGRNVITKDGEVAIIDEIA